MIKDNLKNIKLYLGLSDRFKTAFFKAVTMDKFAPLGRVQIDENVYYTVMEYIGRPTENATAEAHKNYADIQIILSGNEKIGYAPLHLLQNTIPYDSTKDIEILSGNYDYVTMYENDFMLLFPDDGHAPSLDLTGEIVKKVVFKVKLN